MNDELGTAVAAEIAAGDDVAAYLHADVTDEEAVRRPRRGGGRGRGRLDIVVNNAGVVAVQTVEESTVADWDRVMAVNVRSIS